jgi:hypothetical protein
MSKENRILLAGLAMALLLPWAVGALLGWPTWITVPVFAAILFGIYRKLMYGIRSATDHVGALLDQISLYSGNPVRDLTAHRIAKLIEAAGNPHVADEIRAHFDTLGPQDLSN